MNCFIRRICLLFWSLFCGVNLGHSSFDSCANSKWPPFFEPISPCSNIPLCQLRSYVAFFPGPKKRRELCCLFPWLRSGFYTDMSTSDISKDLSGKGRIERNCSLHPEREEHNAYSLGAISNDCAVERHYGLIPRPSFNDSWIRFGKEVEERTEKKRH